MANLTEKQIKDIVRKFYEEISKTSPYPPFIEYISSITTNQEDIDKLMNEFFNYN